MDGYKQGASKRAQMSGAGSSVICRRNLFKAFSQLNNLSIEKLDLTILNYRECKEKSTEYHQKWSNLRQFYQHWITDERKLDVQKFKLS